MKGFLSAAGSVPGTEHVKPGEPGWTNNHDAFGLYSTEDCLIAVVSDGCGSMPHSEVGSKIVCRLVIKRLLPLIGGGLWDSQITISGALRILKFALVSDLKSEAEMLSANGALYAFTDGMPAGIIPEYFFCTIVCVAMTDLWTALFSFGDGVISLNGETTTLRPARGNAPPYIGQTLVPGCMREELLHFSLVDILPTGNVQSVLIGTDGVQDLLAAADRRLPGKTESVGALSQFWTNDKFVKNPDAIRRRLALANLETVEYSTDRFGRLIDGPRIKRGLLSDDTTLAVVKRMKEGEA